MSLHIEVRLRELTDHDRCDRCNAKAYLLVKTPTGELLFCAHHGKEAYPKIQELRYPHRHRL